MWVMLRLPDRLPAILEDHYGGIARSQVTIQALPEPCNLMHLVDGQLHKRAVMIAIINHHVGFSCWRLQRRKVIRMHPHLRIRAYFALGDIFAKWAGDASLAAIHAMRRIYHKLPQNRIPCRLFHTFLNMHTML